MVQKKPNLDEATLLIAERMLRMPPKPHGDMKIGKPRAKRDKSLVVRKSRKDVDQR
jgi:hypothetical protein